MSTKMSIKIVAKYTLAPKEREYIVLPLCDETVCVPVCNTVSSNF